MAARAARVLPDVAGRLARRPVSSKQNAGDDQSVFRDQATVLFRPSRALAFASLRFPGRCPRLEMFRPVGAG